MCECVFTELIPFCAVWRRMSEHSSDSMKMGDVWHALQLTELLRALCNQLPILPVLRWGWGRPDSRVPWALFRQRVGEINGFVHLETLQGVYEAFHLLIFLCQFLPNLGSEKGKNQHWFESTYTVPTPLYSLANTCTSIYNSQHYK